MLETGVEELDNDIFEVVFQVSYDWTFFCNYIYFFLVNIRYLLTSCSVSRAYSFLYKVNVILNSVVSNLILDHFVIGLLRIKLATFSVGVLWYYITRIFCSNITGILRIIKQNMYRRLSFCRMLLWYTVNII